MKILLVLPWLLLARRCLAGPVRHDCTAPFTDVKTNYLNGDSLVVEWQGWTSEYLDVCLGSAHGAALWLVSASASYKTQIWTEIPSRNTLDVPLAVPSSLLHRSNRFHLELRSFNSDKLLRSPSFVIHDAPPSRVMARSPSSPSPTFSARPKHSVPTGDVGLGLGVTTACVAFLAILIWIWIRHLRKRRKAELEARAQARAQEVSAARDSINDDSSDSPAAGTGNAGEVTDKDKETETEMKDLPAKRPAQPGSSVDNAMLARLGV